MDVKDPVLFLDLTGVSKDAASRRMTTRVIAMQNCLMSEKKRTTTFTTNKKIADMLKSTSRFNEGCIADMRMILDETLLDDVIKFEEIVVTIKGI